MSSSAQIREKIAALARKRADLEKKMGDAQQARAKKEAEAQSRRASAERSTSPSSVQSYLRQARSAEDAAIKESGKIADLSKRVADVAREEGNLQRDLTSALRSEASAEARERQRLQREREAADRREEQHRREADRRRERARIEEEQRRAAELARIEADRTADRAQTVALINESEGRLLHELDSIREPVREPLRILYATAATRGDLRVDEEIRRVKAAVRSATHRDLVQIEHLPAATAGDLLDGLTSFRPHVVHFSGHANENLLVFDDGGLEPNPGNQVSARAFKSAVEAPDEPPLLVVLNACRSAAQLEGLVGRVPMAVGMSDSIGDVDAITFATRFYRTLAEGQSVTAALATARVDMQMNGLLDHELPTLVTVAELDASSIQLVQA